jgi:hypothetical protein
MHPVITITCSNRQGIESRHNGNTLSNPITTEAFAVDIAAVILCGFEIGRT